MIAKANACTMHCFLVVLDAFGAKTTRDILHYKCSSGSITIVLQYHHLFWRHSLNTLERRIYFLF
jgi:hypothetical protein